MSSPAARKAKIQAATPRQGPNRFVLGTVVAVIAIIAVVAGTILANRSTQDAAKEGGSALPKGVSAMGAGLLTELNTAPADAPVLDIYEDFQCPYCGQFEASFGPALKALQAAGTVQVRYHVLTFLDGNLGNDSSTRAANAAMCAADDGKFAAYHEAVFANLPAEEGTGYTDDQLKAFAGEAGITGPALTAWETCVADKAHNQYVVSVQDQSDDDKVRGTPTLRVDGTELDLQTLTPDNLEAQILAAAK